MARWLRFWATVFVGVGAIYAFTGRNREAAPALLILGLLLAAASLLIDGGERG